MIRSTGDILFEYAVRQSSYSSAVNTIMDYMQTGDDVHSYEITDPCIICQYIENTGEEIDEIFDIVEV